MIFRPYCFRWIVALGSLLAGCDRGVPPMVNGSAPLSVSVNAIGSLNAGAVTSLFARDDGTTLSLQADAEKPVLVLSGRRTAAAVSIPVPNSLPIDVPTAVPITAPISAAISAAALRDRLGAAGGELSIRAVAPLDRRRLVVYAAGSQRRTSLASLWVIDPAANTTTLVASAAALASASGLGDSLDLADAQCVATDRGVWLCLYHSDAAVFFLLPAGLGPGTLLHPAFTRLKSETGPVRLMSGDRLFARGAEETTADAAGILAGDAASTSAGAAAGNSAGGVAEGLGLLKEDGRVLAIGVDGRVSELPPLETGARASAPPLPVTVNGQDGRYRLDFLVSDGPAPDPFTATAGDRARYPKLVLSPLPTGTGIAKRNSASPAAPPPTLPAAPAARRIVFDRDAITVRPGFPVHSLRLTAWCQDPASGDVIAYDAFSGEVMRIKLPVQ